MTASIYEPSHVESHRVDESGDLILHDAASGQMVVLNAVGASAFELVDGERSVDEIAHEIAEAFSEIERERVITDVRVFLADLAARGLIVSKAP